jgi:hypothetical protein
MARPCLTLACVLALVACPLAATRAGAESITVPFSVEVTHVFSSVPDMLTPITGGSLQEGTEFRGVFSFNPDLPNRDPDPTRLGLFGPAGTLTLDLPWASSFGPPTFETEDNGFLAPGPGADLFSLGSGGHSLLDPDAMLIPILSFVDPAGAALSGTALPRSIAAIQAFPVKEFRMAFSRGEEDGSLFVGTVRLNDTSPVPEPAGVFLAAAGLLVLTIRVWTHRRNRLASSPALL